MAVDQQQSPVGAGDGNRKFDLLRVIGFGTDDDDGWAGLALIAHVPILWVGTDTGSHRLFADQATWFKIASATSRMDSRRSMEVF